MKVIWNMDYIHKFKYKKGNLVNAVFAPRYDENNKNISTYIY